MKKNLLAILLCAATTAAMAQSTITSGTNSNAAQTSTITNVIGGGSPDQNVHYDGSYSMKNAPTVYAPGLTASMTETCWGSVSGAVSVVGVGATLGATVKDMDCNRRLTAAVAWRMERRDVAFNLMCQDADFRAAAEDTDKPCKPLKTAVTGVDARQGEPTDPFVRERMGLAPLAAK